jgi:GNAT superfamily N-acetyltransferase
VRLRLVRPEDKDRLRAGFEKLSPESRYLRFFVPKPHLTEAELRYLTELDGVDHVAIGAARLDDDGEEGDGLGVARFIRVADEPDCAEAAIAVLDEIQGKGLGTLLFLRLVAAAKARDVARFRCEVLGENTAMAEMISGVAPDRTIELKHGISTIEFELPDVAPREAAAEAPRQSPLFRFFRAVAEGALEWREAVARLALRERSRDRDRDPDDQ